MVGGAGAGTGRWHVAGHSVRGAAHVRTKAGNQDAIAWLPETGSGSEVVLSVADGHGSPRSWRSATGAKLAITVSHAIAMELLRLSPRGSEFSVVTSSLEQDVPRRIVRDWRARVEEHLRREPLSEEELTRAAGDPLLVYGTTLVTAIATPAYMTFWQIGDGDLVAVSASGDADRALPKDAAHVGNETMSLCSPDAWNHFRVGFHGTVSPLLLLSTDGLANSFQDDAGFLRFGSDVARLIATDGMDAVTARLEGWLEDASARGSGDDISLGLVCRPDLF